MVINIYVLFFGFKNSIVYERISKLKKYNEVGEVFIFLINYGIGVL